MIKGKWQIATTALGTMIVIVAFANDASARRGVRHAHFGKLSWHSRAAPDDSHPALMALPAMRYYGGPKSPMWRG
jgi:hypothetical protein